MKNLIPALFLLCSVISTSRATIVIPVTVHVYESHPEYTDAAIANMICEMNRNFDVAGGCAVTPSDIRFALQTINRGTYAGTTSYTSFLTDVGGMVPYHLNIYLYDFSDAGVGVWNYYASRNSIAIKKLGFNAETFTHEAGHFLGLEHVSGTASILKNHYYSCPDQPNDLGGSWGNNFMIASTHSACCYFSTNQNVIMQCVYDTYHKPAPPEVSLLAASYPALLSNVECIAPAIVFQSSGNNHWANFILPSSCPTWFSYYTYSIRFCRDGELSPCDVTDAPTTGTGIVLPACTEGILTCKAYYFGGGVNIVTKRFNTKTPGCAVPCYCALLPESRLAGASEEEEPTIYPVPTRDVLHVTNSTTIEQYMLLDLSGKIIRTGPASDEIAVGDLAPAQYLLRVTGKRTTKVFKFYKQ